MVIRINARIAHSEWEMMLDRLERKQNEVAFSEFLIKKQFLMKTTLRRHTMVICWLLFVGNCDDYQRGGEAWDVKDFVTKKIK